MSPSRLKHYGHRLGWGLWAAFLWARTEALKGSGMESHLQYETVTTAKFWKLLLFICLIAHNLWKSCTEIADSFNRVALSLSRIRCTCCSIYTTIKIVWSVKHSGSHSQPHYWLCSHSRSNKTSRQQEMWFRWNVYIISWTKFLLCLLMFFNEALLWD